MMYEYQASITRVVDGDTLVAEVDLGFEVRFTMPIRLYGINAPELKTPEGVKARQFAIDWLGAAAWVVTLRTVKDRTEKYGRYLGVIVCDTAKPSLNEALVASGNAVPYMGGAR